MYSPPSKEISYFINAYNEGYQAGVEGKKLKDNPYKPSNHERDTTFEDELYYYWSKGFEDFFEE